MRHPVSKESEGSNPFPCIILLYFQANENKNNKRYYTISKNNMVVNKNTKNIKQKTQQGFSIDRLIFFNDAVFAIAITLLAIDIRVPQLAENLIASQLNNEIIGLAPKLISFILTFFIVGSYWISYHRTIYLIKRCNRRLISLNLLFLMFIVLLPFPNDLIGKYPTQQIAVIVYATILSATGISMCLIWFYASSKYRLIDEKLHPQFIKNLTLRLFISPFIFLISIPISFLNPLLSLSIWFLVFPIGIYFERTYLRIEIYKNK